INCSTGEAVSRDEGLINTAYMEYWNPAYEIIRYCAYFLENIDQYEDYFLDKTLIPHWKAEIHFLRAFTYFSLAKRYGGVPILDKTQEYPANDPEDLRPFRNSEQEVYDFIEQDMDYAINNLYEKSEAKGCVNKYIAAAFKSRVMLFAGSIARHNQLSLMDDTGKRLLGIPSSEAARYFKSSYEAAKSVENVYSLYKGSWKADDKDAQIQNYVNVFFDESSPENIFVRQYSYPNTVYSFDALAIPSQMLGPSGYASFWSPTLDFVELFDGFPKTVDGRIDVLDENGNYKFYNSRIELFADAEPRLRASVLVPGETFKGEEIDYRRGIYTGAVGAGIPKFISENSTAAYDHPDIHESSAWDAQMVVTLPDGTRMNAGGLSGFFKANRRTSATGILLRKYINPGTPADLVNVHMSEQGWIELRYAEVLLNRAEAAFELFLLGETDVDYQADAFQCINELRERAGADLLTGKTDLDPNTMVNVGSLAVPLGLQTIRIERKKELFFENKIWWDMKRWRTADQELNNTRWRMLNPFYVAENKQYIFDVRLEERNRAYTFEVNWYYEKIPTPEINKNGNLVQNIGY
ncbi:MAG: RagB/SusD family nutrient uptake outer membrane protein, partial [Bacteroides sp.]|nr:RagB/SusD family nutrient uptake outer membrane protein [Bacteroides sp.]